MEKAKTGTTGRAKNEVEHPIHYNNHPSGVECCEIIRHEPYNIGAAIKYIWRRDLKGNAMRDLQKAIECLKDEISKLEKL